MSDFSSNQGYDANILFVEIYYLYCFYKRLLVHGLNMPVKTIEITDKTPEFKYLEEEIFEIEGNYEELIICLW